MSIGSAEKVISVRRGVQIRNNTDEISFVSLRCLKMNTNTKPARGGGFNRRGGTAHRGGFTRRGGYTSREGEKNSLQVDDVL